MKSWLALIGVSAVAFLVVVESSSAQSTIAQWNFNSVPPDGAVFTGTKLPSAGSGTLSTVGGAVGGFSPGSPGDPAGGTDNSGLDVTNWAPQATGSGTRGLQVATSTVGYNDITISLDFEQTAFVSRFFQLQIATDGVTFSNVNGGVTSIGTIGSGNTGTTFTSSGLYSDNPGNGTPTFVQSISYTLGAGGNYESDPNFAFRWVAVFAPSTGTYTGAFSGTTAGYSQSGSSGRFDMVTVTGDALAVPEPGTIALDGIGLTALAGLSRRRKS